MSPTLRLLLDLDKSDAGQLDKDVDALRLADNVALDQTFPTLRLAIVTSTLPDLFTRPFGFAKSPLGDLNSPKDNFFQKLRQEIDKIGEIGEIGKIGKIEKVGPIDKIGPIHKSMGVGLSNPAGATPTPLVLSLSSPEASPDWPFAVTGLGTTTYTGRAVRVGVLDTGASDRHLTLRGRFTYARVTRLGDGGIGQTCLLPAADRDGHGTAVASIIAGRDPRGGRLGVAPDCTLYVADITRSGSNEWEDVQLVTALEWMATQGVRIVNISMTGETPVEGHDTVLKAARRVGILPVAAIGNTSCGKTAAVGNSRYALSVGALDAPDAVARVSGCGELAGTPPIQLPKLLAPGRVRSALLRDKPAGLDVLPRIQEEIVVLEPMTSYAAPFVTGIAALLLEACPSANVDQLEAALCSSPLRLSRGATCACAATPVVNFEAALDTLRGFGLPILPPPAGP